MNHRFRKSPTKRSPSAASHKNPNRVAAGKRAAETRRQNESLAAVVAVADEAAAVASVAAAASDQAIQQSNAAIQISQHALRQSSATREESSSEESSSESQGTTYHTPTTYHSPHVPHASGRRGCPNHILVLFGLIGMVVGAVICVLGIFRHQYSKVQLDPMGQPVLDQNGEAVRQVNLMNVLLTIVISILCGAAAALIACMMYERYRS